MTKVFLRPDSRFVAETVQMTVEIPAIAKLLKSAIARSVVSIMTELDADDFANMNPKRLPSAIATSMTTRFQNGLSQFETHVCTNLTTLLRTSKKYSDISEVVISDIGSAEASYSTSAKRMTISPDATLFISRALYAAVANTTRTVMASTSDVDDIVERVATDLMTEPKVWTQLVKFSSGDFVPNLHHLAVLLAHELTHYIHFTHKGNTKTHASHLGASAGTEYKRIRKLLRDMQEYMTTEQFAKLPSGEQSKFRDEFQEMRERHDLLYASLVTEVGAFSTSYAAIVVDKLGLNGIKNIDQLPSPAKVAAEIRSIIDTKVTPRFFVYPDPKADAVFNRLVRDIYKQVSHHYQTVKTKLQKADATKRRK